MASLQSIRQAVQDARRERNLPHYAYQPWDRPQTEIIQQQLQEESNRHLHAGFQTLKDDPEKFGEGDEDQIRKKHEKKKSLLISQMMDRDKEIDEEMVDEIADEKHKVPWKNPSLIKPLLVQNLDTIIPTLRDKHVIWDHGATPAGRRSDLNFFNWLEEYARLEHKKKRDRDMSPFNPIL